jgi:uncharacterized protein YehS (DUF1456 family)
MNNNDILRRLRFAVNCSDAAMLEMLELAGLPVSRRELDSLFLRDDEQGYAECDDAVLSALLDGMILKFRGKKEDARGAAEQTGQAAGLVDSLDNNMILKKIRIALELKEEDLIAVMKLVDIDLSKAELTALFRRKGHKNYKPCMDQFLRNFLVGLAKYRSGM